MTVAKNKGDLDHIAETMDKLLAIELWTRGATQESIAKVLGRSKTWVNDLLKAIPKGGKLNAENK
jgi:predicted transcriptional regulator